MRLVLGAVTTTRPLTERAAPWGWKPGNGGGAVLGVWVTVNLIKGTMTHVGTPPGKLPPKLRVFLAEQFTEDRKGRGTAWESGCPHADEDSGLPRHPESEGPDEQGSGGSGSAAAASRRWCSVRLTGSLWLHSFYKGTFRFLAVSLKWTYATSEACAPRAHKCAFPS